MIPALVLAAAAISAGTLLAALLGGPWWVTALLAATLALARALQSRDAREVAVLLAAVALASGAHARYEALASAPPPPLAALSGVHTVTGIVRQDALLRGSLAQVDLEVERVDERPERGGLRLRLPAPREPLIAGERLRFTGRIAPPASREPEGAAFDYAAYLRDRDVYLVSAYPTAWDRLGQTAPAWRLALDGLRRRAVDHIERTLPEPEAALAAGVLVGERGTLPPRDPRRSASPAPRISSSCRDRTSRCSSGSRSRRSPG